MESDTCRSGTIGRSSAPLEDTLASPAFDCAATAHVDFKTLQAVLVACQ